MPNWKHISKHLQSDFKGTDGRAPIVSLHRGYIRLRLLLFISSTIWTDLARDLCLAGSPMWCYGVWHIMTWFPLTYCRRSGGIWRSTSQPAVTQKSPQRLSDKGIKNFEVKHKNTIICREASQWKSCSSVGISARSRADSENRMLHAVTEVQTWSKRILCVKRNIKKAERMGAKQLCYFSSCWTF